MKLETTTSAAIMHPHAGVTSGAHRRKKPAAANIARALESLVRSSVGPNRIAENAAAIASGAMNKAKNEAGGPIGWAAVALRLTARNRNSSIATAKAIPNSKRQERPITVLSTARQYAIGLESASKKSPTMEAARSRVVKMDNSLSESSTLGTCVSCDYDPLQQASICALGPLYGGGARFCHGEIPFGASSALRRWITQTARDEPLLFQAIQGGIKSAGRGIAVRARSDLRANRHAICSFAQAQDREKNDLLELAKTSSHRISSKK